jgi:RND family efflux transporter MFP subunit
LVDQLSSDLASLRIDRDENPERRSGLRRFGAIVVVLAMVGAAGWYAYPRVRGEIYKTEVSVSEISTISPAQASITVTSTGYVVPQLISKVGAKLPGRISRVLVKEGDNVKAGQVIAELEAADQRASIAAAGSRVAVARARVASAKANLAEVTQQVEREKVLVTSGAINKATLDDLVARQAGLAELVKAAEADVQAAAADGNTLSVSLLDRTIRAPIDGTIIEKPVAVGELVGPIAATNAAVAEIADFKSQLAEVDVPEGRLHLVKIGGPCEIVLDAYPDKRYRGQAVEIGRRVDRAKATVKVKVRFVDDLEGVIPDMSARVSFLTEALSDAALKQAPKKIVPGAAVVERGGRKVVFVLDGSVVHSAPVTVGPPMGSSFELLEGPASGSRVVSNPPPEMSDGQKIKEKGN